MSRAFEQGYRAHSAQRLLQSMNGNAARIDLEWGEHPTLGRSMLIRMPDPDYNIVITPGESRGRYHVFPAYLVPGINRESLSEDASKEVARLIKQAGETTSGTHEEELPYLVVQSLIGDIANKAKSARTDARTERTRPDHPRITGGEALGVLR